MFEMQTMVQTELTINGESALLAQGSDIDDLKQRIEAASATTGRFIDFVIVGNRGMSVLITPTTQVAVTVSTVQFDERDTGDEDAPFGSFYDM